MIRLPLKRVILLFVDGKIYLCRVIHAGQDVVTCVDCYERIVTIDGVFYVEDGLGGKVRFDRSKISGYKLVEDSELEKIYEDESEENEKLLKEYIDDLAKRKRESFRVIKNPSFDDELVKKSGEIINLE